MLLARAMQYPRLLPSLVVTFLILTWRLASRARRRATRCPSWRCPTSAREPFHSPVGRTTEIELAGASVRGGALRYTSSDFELEWVNHTRRGGICKLATSAAHVKSARDWLNYSQAVFRPNGMPPRPPTAAESAVLSHFRASARPEPIEPLSGVARHPLARKLCAWPKGVRPADKFDITYLVLHNACGVREARHGSRAKVVLFDLGMSEGFKGIPGGVPDAAPDRGGALAPSTPLLYRMFADRCLAFDEMYGWEIDKKIASTEWWGSLPPEMRRKVHFYEVPIDEDREAVGGVDTPRPNSFIQFLKATVTKEDFVVVKVDIDTPAVELTIVEAIAARPELSSLVDEIFFEYHFYFDGRYIGWEPVHNDVDDALRLMLRLRQAGVRAHFWI